MKGKNASSKRLDLLLQEQRPELSRSLIQAEIMAGRVTVDGQVCDKPGTAVSKKARIEMEPPECCYVSRGGLKLAYALEDLKLKVDGLTVLDVGSSTGGFTDCLLQKGAVRVYALDVGYGQLDWNLRRDPRVVVMERFNVRDLSPADLPRKPDLAVIDVSFISLDKVIPVMRELAISRILALVKPQFEAGRREAGRGRGVIRDPGIHMDVLSRVVSFSCSLGYCCREITFSRLRGPRGNLEYFLCLGISPGGCSCCNKLEERIKAVVASSHQEL